MKKNIFKILGIVAIMGLMGYNLYISQPETKLFSNLTLDEMVSSAEAFEEGGGGEIEWQFLWNCNTIEWDYCGWTPVGCTAEILDIQCSESWHGQYNCSDVCD